MKLIHNGVIKDIPEQLVSIYINIGWKPYKKPIKQAKPNPKLVEKKTEE